MFELTQFAVPPVPPLHPVILWTAVASPIVALLVGGGQCLLIWLGIRAMRDSNKSREPLLESLQATTASLREVTTDLREQRLASQDQSTGIRELLQRSG